VKGGCGNVLIIVIYRYCVGTETDCDNIITVGGAVNLDRRCYSHRAKLLVRVCYGLSGVCAPCTE